MNVLRNIALAVGGAGLLASLIAASGTAAGAPTAPGKEASGLASFVPDPGAVLRWCGQEQSGTRQLGEDLGRRARGLDERERTLQAREGELRDAESRLEQRMQALSQARSQLESQLDAADGERTKRLAGLVKMVESNRASDIAPMFGKLEPELAVEVLDRMNRGKAGKLLAVLPPDAAASLAQRMTRPVDVALP
jgi:flagellar motility protein MotE (MotC chaperone)